MLRSRTPRASRGVDASVSTQRNGFAGGGLRPVIELRRSPLLKSRSAGALPPLASATSASVSSPCSGVTASSFGVSLIPDPIEFSAEHVNSVALGSIPAESLKYSCSIPGAGFTLMGFG